MVRVPRKIFVCFLLLFGMQTPLHLPAQAAPLTEEEQTHARSAWQYFRDNYQSQTGFVNAVENYPSSSMWDMGNYLMALNAARSLNLITQADFDARLNQFLTSLARIPLFDSAVPNKAYNTQTGEMVDYNNKASKQGIGWSALDLGRLLTALYVIKESHPQYSDWIQGVLSNWKLAQAIEKGQLSGVTVLPSKRSLKAQEGRLGYEEYAAKGFELWGLRAEKSLNRALNRKWKKIYGVTIPVDKRSYRDTNASNYVLSESYIMHGIEFGFDAEMQDIADRILEVQKRRYQATGILTAVSEDHVKGEPYFLYNTIYANGVEWAAITDQNKSYPALRSVSTKAAFGWKYLYSNHPYAQKLLDTVKKLQRGHGFYAGLFERSNTPNQILTANTNGLILEILYYKARGNRPLIQPASAKSSSSKSPANKSAASKSPVVLGVYSAKYLGNQATVNSELQRLDQWTGKKMSIAGLFTDIEDDNPAYNIPQQLETLHQNGYSAFLNLRTRHPVAHVADGKLDRSLHQIAKAYAGWAKRSGRVALIAPFPEMNGSWEPYREDPANYKRAYQRIQRIFAEAGVPKQSVQWVFAPNGWNSGGQHRFENYYPGDAIVDVVSFSAYNWGYCHNAAWKEWSTPQMAFEPYLRRMRSMAPTKPIFIAQTATTSVTAQGKSEAEKGKWLRETYRYLSTAPNVRGIVYFNLQKECDWLIHSTGYQNQGYKDAVNLPAFGYLSPQTLIQTPLKP